MKKIMFNSVALLAFSVAGIANNTIEKVEKDLAKEVHFVESNSALVSNPLYCGVLYASEFISLTEGMGISESAAGQIALGAYQECMGSEGLSN